MDGDLVFLAGGGELGALLRAKDWSATPLGPPAAWPRSLRTAVRIMLTSRQPTWIGWGKELTCLYNDAYKPLIGGRHPWAVGRPAAEVWPDIWADIGPILSAAMRGDERTYAAEQLLVMERSGCPQENCGIFSCNPVPSDEGGTGGVICASADDAQRCIGQRQRAPLRPPEGAQVQRSEARLQAAVDLVGLSPYSWDPVTGALDWDDRLRSIWGLAPGAPVHMGVFLAGIHPDDRARVEAAIAACTDPAGDGIYHIEYRVVGIGDGVERWVSTHGRTFFEEGRPVSFVGAALEITERKRAEAALRESEARFREFAEHSASVLWVTDLEGMQIEYLSPAFETLWGRPPGAMPQGLEHWTDSIHPEDQAHALAAMERARRGEPTIAEYRIRRPEGGTRWIRDTLFPIRDERGRTWRLGGIAQDITLHGGTRVYVVGARTEARQSLALLLGRAGYEVQSFDAAHAFLDAAPALVPGCVVLDFSILGADGTLVARELKARRIRLPVIALGESRSGIGTAVQAMKAGAVDWIEVLYDDDAMLEAVASALAGTIEAGAVEHAAGAARTRISALSAREREVLQGLLAGGTNKTIARDLELSPRTVEIHRAHVMESLGARTLADLVLLATAAGVRPRS